METVVILTTQPGPPDSTSEPTPGVEVETPYQCVVWPSSGRDDLEVGVYQTIDEWVVSFPAGVVVPADARARIRGGVFNAVAEGFDWVNPHTGHRPGATVTFRKVGTGG